MSIEFDIAPGACNEVIDEHGDRRTGNYVYETYEHERNPFALGATSDKKATRLSK